MVVSGQAVRVDDFGQLFFTAHFYGKSLGHRHAMCRSFFGNELIARRNLTRYNHAKVCSAIAAMSKRFYPAFLIQPGGKGCAWGARYGNFQNRGAKAHALVDHQLSKINALRGEVFTKSNIGDRHARYLDTEIKISPDKGV